MSVIEVKRKKGETFEALFRRCTRRIQQSGKQLDLRSGRFFTRTPKKNKLHDSAIRSIVKGGRREYLLKTGKAREEDFRPVKRR